MVSEIVLLQGSWYALEQAGRLLRASVVVFNANDPATALALAMFGREELGRSRILQDIAAEVAAGRSLSPKEVANRCDDHVRKQRAGLLSTTLRVNPPSALAEALRTTVSSSPRSDQWTTSRKIIKAASAAKMKRDPDVRHGKRENALYVDLDHSGTSWSRPCTIRASVAREEIEDAVNDYAIQCDKLRDDVIAADFPKMASAQAAMQPIPVLLPPIWPA
jgi:AbiV family abortive infection protein